MKRIITIGFIIAALLAAAAPAAFAITWKGLDWTVRGGANSAVVDGNDYLAITVLGGSSADPTPDNWAVYAKPSTSCMWMEFTFTDPGGDYGPRAYSSGKIIGGGEMLMQGGVRPPTFPDATYTNLNVYTSAWVFNNWNQPYSNRTPGDHTFKVGLGANGEVDFFYDGILVEAYRIGQSYYDAGSDTYVPFTWQSDYLNIAYLGVRAALNESATIIYKDFQWGTEYQPVPLPGTLLLLGSGLTGLVLWRRRKGVVNKG